MTPRTRLDRVVQLREKVEEEALAKLARAQASVGKAQVRLEDAVRVTRVDARRAGPVELWQLDELARRRALQAVRNAEADVISASRHENTARDGYATAHQGKEIVERVQGRRRAEILDELALRERRTADEVATLRFNAPE